MHARAHRRYHTGRFMAKDVGQVRNISMPIQNVEVCPADAATAGLN
jgi:hypothetical protein